MTEPYNVLFLCTGNSARSIMAEAAAGEACPFWPGQPISAHWSVEDPAAVVADEPAQRVAFHRAYTTLERRIKRFVELPLDEMDPVALKKQLDDIGNTQDA